MCSSQIYTRILTMCEAADSVVCQMFVSTFHPVFPRSFQFENISSLWARLWWLISAWELTTPSVPQRGEGFFHQCVSRASLLCKYRNTFNPGSNTQKTAATTNNYQLKISLNSEILQCHSHNKVLKLFCVYLSYSDKNMKLPPSNNLQESLIK